MYMYIYIYRFRDVARASNTTSARGVPSLSRLLNITGLFCKEPYKRDDILQKRPTISRSLLVVCLEWVMSCLQWVMSCLQWVMSTWLAIHMTHSEIPSWVPHSCIQTYIYIHIYKYIYMCVYLDEHGVATITRLLKIISLFCRISSLV